MKIRPRLFGDEDNSRLLHIIDSNKLALNIECTKIIEALLKEYVRLKKEGKKENEADRECLGSLFQGIVNYLRVDSSNPL